MSSPGTHIAEKLSGVATIDDPEQAVGGHCTVCNREQQVFVREGRDLYRPENSKKYKLTRCSACGHIMQNPQPNANELSEAYSSEYAPYQPAWKETKWSVWRILRELTTYRRIRRLKRYAKGERLLDVGCGAGDFVYAAHRQGWNVSALEYSQELAERIRLELGFDARDGELQPGIWNPESFDAIVLWSVIEHVPNPLETLITASSYLKSGGIVFLQFPTVEGVEAGQFFGECWALLDLPRHLNFFGRKSLSELCNEAGLEMTAYKTPFLDIAWCHFASCANLAKQAGGRAQRLPRLAMALTRAMLSLPYMAVQAWRRSGTEAFAVAVKR